MSTETPEKSCAGSCLICGHEKPFAAWSEGVGVCESCRYAATHYADAVRDRDNAQQWVDSDPDWKAQYNANYASLERRNSELTAEASGLRMALAIANKSADDQMFQKREAESKVSELTARIAKLEKERDALDRDYQMEKAIVSRIWRMFGNPTYAELNGRSIYDLIAEARKDSARLLSELNIAHNALDLAAQRFDTMDQPGFRDDCMHAILPPTTPLPETKGQL